LEQGKEIPPSEEKFIRLDGGEIDVEVAAAPLFFQDQPMVLVVGRDITGRKRVEEALRRSEEKYRTLVDHATDVIVIIQDEQVKFYNPKTLPCRGTLEELSRIPFIDLIHPEDRDGVLDRYQRRIRGEDVPSRQTLRFVNKAGEELWGQINSVPIVWEGRPATLNFVRDITREKKLEVQFQHAQKMEAVGTLPAASPIFNNLLMMDMSP
jgi:PAS domain S-box-containing protein